MYIHILDEPVPLHEIKVYPMKREAAPNTPTELLLYLCGISNDSRSKPAAYILSPSVVLCLISQQETQWVPIVPLQTWTEQLGCKTTCENKAITEQHRPNVYVCIYICVFVCVSRS